MARNTNQELAHGAITVRQPRERTQQVVEPTDDWEPLSSEPTSTALMVEEQELEHEIMEERWEVQSAKEEYLDDDNGLALEEANLEHVSNLNDAMEIEVREGILNGTIPSVAYDTAATSSCGKYGDPFISTGHLSTKVF